ncbi:helix-turn-helix domain-containing protein [Halobiforma nitratireducens]|uniref:Putative transcriptional regulator n=1 Tax=Halobiforma nitratireducens JCM 10879 TaxID=1227454 RepID=M0MN89_9EURY|nr:helix-turn-helix domain-containing protein [Halobiforma nitratireducens]EMA45910.1 putative transcriptional regulator [Halobiforma nitratireducens JCM 10879]
MSPNRTRDEDTGQFDEKHSSNRYLEAVDRLEPTTTGEVADELDCHRNTARRHLEKLADAGEIEKIERSGAFLWTTN